MFTNKNEGFGKVLKKLNSSAQKVDLSIKTKPQSSENSFLQDLSIRSDKSTKYGSQINPKSTQPMSEERAAKVLFDSYEVLINRVRNKLHAEFVPTSSGLRYILVMNDNYVNLSWVHSVQELEKNKMLLLYYDLSEILEDKKPKIETLVIEFSREGHMGLFIQALTFIHSHHHDDEVEKLYHYFC